MPVKMTCPVLDDQHIKQWQFAKHVEGKKLPLAGNDTHFNIFSTSGVVPTLFPCSSIELLPT